MKIVGALLIKSLIFGVTRFLRKTGFLNHNQAQKKEYENKVIDGKHSNPD